MIIPVPDPLKQKGPDRGGGGGGEEPISLILPVQTAVLVHIGQVPDLAQHGHRQLRAQHHVPHLHTEQKVRFPRH
jgi:hypothetical protein